MIRGMFFIHLRFCCADEGLIALFLFISSCYFAAFHNTDAFYSEKKKKSNQAIQAQTIV